MLENTAGFGLFQIIPRYWKIYSIKWLAYWLTVAFIANGFHVIGLKIYRFLIDELRHRLAACLLMTS